MKPPFSEDEYHVISQASLDLVKRNSVRNVRELIRKLSPRYSEDSLISAIRQMQKENKIILLPASSSISTIFQYYTSVWSFEFWIMISLVFAELAVLRFFTAPSWSIYDMVLGLVFSLYLPGYSLSEIIFMTRNKISGVERFVLSFALSIAIIIAVGLILTFTPPGLTVTSIVYSLSIITGSLAFIASIRKYSLFFSR